MHNLETALERVGPGAPPGEEDGEADGLEDAGEGADGDGVEWALLGHDLGDELDTSLAHIFRDILIELISHRRSRRSKEDQATEVRGALVAERAGGIDERTHAVRLDGGADEGSAPCGAGGGGLLGLEELLLGVGGLGLAVCVAEERAEDGEGCGVVEDGADGDGRGLDGREVCVMARVSLGGFV